MLLHRHASSTSHPAPAPRSLHTRAFRSTRPPFRSELSQQCKPLSASPPFASRSCCAPASVSSSASSAVPASALTATSLSAEAQPFAHHPAFHQSSISTASSAHSLGPSSLYASSSGSALYVSSRNTHLELLVPHAYGRGEGSSGGPRGGGRGGKGQGRGGRSSSPRGSSGGRGSFSSGSSGGSIPLLEDCLVQAQQLHTGSKAIDIAKAVYNLGKRIDIDANKNRQQVTSSQRDAVVSATQQMVAALLHISPSLPSPAPLAMQLGSKDLSLVSWAVSVLVLFDARAMNAEVQQLYHALAKRALQPEVMEGSPKEVYDWALLLLSIGRMGEKWSAVAENSRVKELFVFAIELRLPFVLTNTGKRCVAQDISNVALACVYVGYKGNMVPFVSAVARKLRGVMADAEPQAWSNLMYACGKLVDLKGGKGSALGKGVNFIMQEGAAAMVRAVSGPMSSQVAAQELANTLWGLAHFERYDAGVLSGLANAFVQRIGSSVPQNVANVLWALAKQGWYDGVVVSKLAFAAVERVSSSVPQNLTNVLWALSTLGWYDCTVYDKLLWGLVESIKQMNSQDMSNAIYSCAVASHSGPAVDDLAGVVSKQDLSDWKAQEVSNSLYAWAALSLLGATSADLNGMACTLFSEANSRAPTAFKEQERSQLYMAHMEALRLGLQGGGLSTANGLQQAAAEQHKQGQAEIEQRSKASYAGKQAMAALQQAGYEVQLGARVGKQGYVVDLLVQHESCPGGLAINVVKVDDFFNHPQGQLDGKVAAVHAQIRQRCSGLVVMGEAEARQPAVVVGAVQQELARASGQGVAVSSSSSRSSSTAHTHPPASPSNVASQPPGLLQPKGRPPPSHGPGSAAAVPPRLQGEPQRKQ